MNFKLGVCNYTIEGRKMIHKNLEGVNPSVLKYLLENYIPNIAVQYNEKRLSRQVGQNGKCGITGGPLEVGDMECHHVKPVHLGGTDDYENLIFVRGNIHKLIHYVESDLIKKLLEVEKVTPVQLKKLNTLRVKAGNCKIKN